MAGDVVTDAERLGALCEAGLLDTPAEQRFDRITRLAARALGAPVALISLVDGGRQFFKSAVGLAEPWASRRETPLTHSFCQYVVEDGQALRIVDARVDPRVATNAAVGDLGVIAYLGVPLRGPRGHALGSLCAIDGVPRNWTDGDEATLRDLAAIVEDQIGLGLSEKRWREILNTMPQMVWSTLPDGYHDFYNDRWYEFTGMPYGSTDGDAWNGMFHADDQDRAWSRWRHSLQTGEAYEIEYRLRHHTGQYRWTLGRALPIRDQHGAIERWFGTCTDVHDLKLAEEQRQLIARELAHRIQNIFAVVGSLVSISARSEPEHREFADTVKSRIVALARSYRYVRPQGVAATFEHDRSAHGLMETLLSPYRDDANPDRISIAGDDAAIDERTATAVALTLHELATNAVKYGALSEAAGHVSVTTERNGEDYRITWREHGGPPVESAPTRVGFGSELVVNAAVSQLGARLQRDWRREGLTVEIVAPIRHFQ